MSNYTDLTQQLKNMACPTCFGRGKVDDADIGDIFFNEWKCPDCKGTGFKQGIKCMLMCGEVDDVAI